MARIVTKIMVEVLSVLALATKQIKQGRLSKLFNIIISALFVTSPLEKFAKKLLGESEIEDMLHRLDRLTRDEARMTGTETLQVVHGLVNNLKLVIGGTRLSGSLRQSESSHGRSNRWFDIHARHMAGSRYAWPMIKFHETDRIYQS